MRTPDKQIVHLFHKHNAYTVDLHSLV